LRQNQLLKTLETVRFSGQLVQTDAAGQQWVFYLSQGAIVYATGGSHTVRRWRRNVAIYCPQMAMHRFTWYLDLASVAPETLSLGWEFALITLWLSRQQISAESAAKLVYSNVLEVMFDIAQAGKVTEQIRQNSSFSSHAEVSQTKPLLLHWAEMSEAAERRWQSWQNAKLAAYSPNQAPVIRQAEQLKNRVPALYQNLSSLLNGQHTLYDLAVQMKRDVVEVTASLLPCLQLKWIELVSLPDFPVPLLRRDVPRTPPPPVAPKKGVIACVDDSVLVRHMMEELLTSAGYQFVGIEDPLRAIGVLLAHKPNLIFLDLMMPNVSGHEVCQQLRKLSLFRYTPIVILTGSDGYVNRLRSNFVGATDFLTKPLDAEAVLGVICKHLEQGQPISQ
jgi:chemotaxis family two-component system response regulator PixG